MLKVDGGGRGKIVKKKPPKKTPPKTAKTIAKKSAAKPKGKAALPGYKVPKKLTRNTTSNRVAGGKATFADVKKMSLADYKKAQAAASKANASKAQSSVAASDWDKGKDWMNKTKNSKKSKSFWSNVKSKLNPFD